MCKRTCRIVATRVPRATFRNSHDSTDQAFKSPVTRENLQAIGTACGLETASRHRFLGRQVFLVKPHHCHQQPRRTTRCGDSFPIRVVIRHCVAASAFFAVEAFGAICAEVFSSFFSARNTALRTSLRSCCGSASTSAGRARTTTSTAGSSSTHSSRQI